MSTTDHYSIRKPVHGSFEEVNEAVREALAEEGFGVLTEIDVRETLKEKLDVDFRPYRILGACNPPLAHRALSEEIDIGLLLPCNVIVYEGDEEGITMVAALDPEVLLGVADRPELEPLAGEVREKIVRALDQVG